MKAAWMIAWEKAACKSKVEKCPTGSHPWGQSWGAACRQSPTALSNHLSSHSWLHCKSDQPLNKMHADKDANCDKKSGLFSCLDRDLPEVIHEASHEAQLVGKAQQHRQTTGVHRHAVAVLCEILDQLRRPATRGISVIWSPVDIKLWCAKESCAQSDKFHRGKQVERQKRDQGTPKLQFSLCTHQSRVNCGMRT